MARNFERRFAHESQRNRRVCISRREQKVGVAVIPDRSSAHFDWLEVVSVDVRLREHGERAATNVDCDIVCGFARPPTEDGLQELDTFECVSGDLAPGSYPAIEQG